jgi:hypothetical protein
MTKNSEHPNRPPMHEALWPKDLFEKGLGWVIVARFKSAGERVEVGIFLVDVFCLGIKLAVYESCDRLTYLDQIRGHYETDFPMEPVEPACARKLVEKAAEYAQGLGFAPHSDYKKAARVFGGISAEQCTQNFSFGLEGKPFYFRGPRETEEQARRIVWQLEKRCGSGNYEYLVDLEDSQPET